VKWLLCMTAAHAHLNFTLYPCLNNYRHEICSTARYPQHLIQSDPTCTGKFHCPNTTNLKVFSTTWLCTWVGGMHVHQITRHQSTAPRASCIALKYALAVNSCSTFLYLHPCHLQNHCLLSHLCHLSHGHLSHLCHLSHCNRSVTCKTTVSSPIVSSPLITSPICITSHSISEPHRQDHVHLPCQCPRAPRHASHYILSLVHFCHLSHCNLYLASIITCHMVTKATTVAFPVILIILMCPWPLSYMMVVHDVR
jgi:hypothetical protein